MRGWRKAERSSDSQSFGRKNPVHKERSHTELSTTGTQSKDNRYKKQHAKPGIVLLLFNKEYFTNVGIRRAQVPLAYAPPTREATILNKRRSRWVTAGQSDPIILSDMGSTPRTCRLGCGR